MAAAAQRNDTGEETMEDRSSLPPPTLPFFLLLNYFLRIPIKKNNFAVMYR